MDVVIARILALLVVAILVAIAARRLSLPDTVGLVIAGIALTLSRFESGVELTQGYQAGRRLCLLIESESLFNDGVAAVLFGLASGWAQASNSDPMQAGWAQLTISGGDIAIGLIAGALAA
jgi:CPA1 family monovalent cation:H+ antiporter